MRAPPLRGATILFAILKLTELFQSAPPLRGATKPDQPINRQDIVSIRAPLRGATAASATRSAILSVSIRAPLARGDPDGQNPRQNPRRFNPLPPCEGRPCWS